MLRSQREICDLLQLDIPKGTSSGEVAARIYKYLKKHGVPASKKARLLLEKNKYIIVRKVKWTDLDSESRKRIKRKNTKKSKPVLKIAEVTDDILSIIMRDKEFANELHGTLNNQGVAIVRFHKGENRLTIEKPTNIREGTGRQNTEAAQFFKEVYVPKLKERLGAGTPEYFQAIQKLAKKCGVKYRRTRQSGEKLSPVMLNMQAQITIVKILNHKDKETKSQRIKLKKAIGFRRNK